jgi:serine/threonine-protein kinase RsbW
MVDDNVTWAFDQWIASDTAAGGEVVDQVLAQMERLGWQDHDRFAVHLAAEEALVNAIKHGNRKARNKYVHVVCRVSPGQVWMQITDQGRGFDPEAVPDPTEDDNLEQPSGRGLMLMRSYMTSVSFNERGNQVTMVKRPSEPSTPDEQEDDLFTE